MPSEYVHGPQDRRLARRYPIACEIQFRIIGRGPSELESGETVNISSSGVLVNISRILTPGRKVEVLVQWPLKLSERVGLKLVIFGEVVRVETQDPIRAALRIDRHEFRTFKLTETGKPLV